MSLNYTTYSSQLSTLTVIASSNVDFSNLLDGAITYAEQRMYRELDLIATRVTDTSGSLTSGIRDFTLPTSVGTFLVVETINVISPAGSLSSVGTKNQISEVAMEWIDAVYPGNNANTGLPVFWARTNNTNIIVGPPPNGAYVMEVAGTQRPAPLSASNSSTILTSMLPDAFMAASMIYASGFMRDFGAQSDNPAQAASWESQYEKLIASAGVEELRKRYQSQAWTSQIPNPVATPPRA